MPKPTSATPAKRVERTYTKGENTRARIIEKASVLFAERGYSGTALTDVMSACGLTKGGFYAHFESKEDLYVTSVRALLERESLKYRRAPASAPAHERLGAFLDWIDEAMATELWGLHFLRILTEPDVNVTNHVVLDAFRPAYDEIRELLGLRSATLDPKVVTPVLLAVALLYRRINAKILHPLQGSDAGTDSTRAVLQMLVDALARPPEAAPKRAARAVKPRA